MLTKLDKKKKELEKKKTEIKILEEEIAKLSLQETSTIERRFPTGSSVTLTGKVRRKPP